MGQWRRAWTVGICLAVVGCGPASPETSQNNERSGSLPDETSPLEGSALPVTAGTPSPLESGTPSLPPRACIPWTKSKPPVRVTACASESVFADGTSQRARYDADSHPLEVRIFTASGVLSQVNTQTWRGGLERLEREEAPNGWFTQTEWTYNAQSRLTRRLITYGTSNNAYNYTYDAQGRISQIVWRIGDGGDTTSRYTYDAAGRLVSIDGDDCGSDETRCATLTYWPNGLLKQHDWEVSGGRESFGDSYNELGQLVHSVMHYDQASAESTRAYDPTGRLVRLRESYSGSGQTDLFLESLTTTVYDSAGQRERFAQDKREECPDSNCGPSHDQDQYLSYTRVTHRTTFICGTQIVALDEWDSNEDGVVDARRTHERDATGRLVHEAYSGTPGLDSGPVSRDFHYDCH